jgi:hypothetical protein
MASAATMNGCGNGATWFGRRVEPGQAASRQREEHLSFDAAVGVRVERDAGAQPDAGARA